MIMYTFYIWYVCICNTDVRNFYTVFIFHHLLLCMCIIILSDSDGVSVYGESIPKVFTAN